MRRTKDMSDCLLPRGPVPFHPVGQLAADRALLGRLANYAYLGRTFAWDIDLEKRIRALTPAQARDALAKHIDPSRISVVKAGDFR